MPPSPSRPPSLRAAFDALFVADTRHRGIQFFRYFFSGGSAFVAYYALLWTFVAVARLPEYPSLVVAYALSIGVNFAIAKYFVFGERSGHAGVQLAKFLGVAVTGLVLQTLLVYLMTHLFSVEFMVANVVASALIYVVSFALNRWLTFRHP